MGDFVIFSYFFRISRLEGFLCSVAPQGDRKSRRLSGSERASFESVFGRFSVGFRRNRPKIDQEPTQSRPLARCSIGVCCYEG